MHKMRFEYKFLKRALPFENFYEYSKRVQPEKYRTRMKVYVWVRFGVRVWEAGQHALGLRGWVR